MTKPFPYAGLQHGVLETKVAICRKCGCRFESVMKFLLPSGKLVIADEVSRICYDCT